MRRSNTWTSFRTFEENDAKYYTMKGEQHFRALWVVTCHGKTGQGTSNISSDI